VLFSLLGGVIAWALAGQRSPRAAPAAAVPPAAFEAYTQAMLEAKGAVALEASGNRVAADAARARAIRRYRAAVAAAPSAPRFRRELGLFLGATGDRRGALAELRQTAAALDRLGLRARARDEAALWPAIFGDRSPTRSAVPALGARVTALSLGWFRHLALEALYRRAGMREAADTERRAAGREALAQQLAMGALVLALIVASIVGLGIGVVFVAHLARGAWRPVGGPFAGPAYPLWEAFLLYLALFAAPALLPGSLGGRLGTGPGDAGAAIARVIAADLLALLPLLYLARVYRRRGLSLEAIGLHAREAIAEVGRGVAGYAAMLPWVIAAALFTQWAGERFFPEVAPPFHPVQALTLGASSPWARVGLFLIVALFAPLWEEIFFRGILQGALRRRFGAVWAVAGSAGLFALLHPQLPLGFVPIFLIGAVLAAFYEWRRSLVPGMVLHAINNGVIFLFLSLLFPASG
jgi:membrane protease YdiL (CAAX protease family)